VHTTGTDLPFLSTFNARACQTLGKDMIWRDYVQGAWRMRRLGKGHTIHLLIAPEIWTLIQREMRSAGAEGLSQSPLRAVGAWLVINSCRSDRLQHTQLMFQDAANVWRRSAFRTLLADPATVDRDQRAGAVDCFVEPVDISIGDTIAAAEDWASRVEKLQDRFGAFCGTEDDQRTLVEVKARLRTGRSGSSELGDSLVLETEITQENEQVQQREQEQEREQQVEIEKCVDNAYSRDEEAQVPWAFDEVIGRGVVPYPDVAHVDPEAAPFYRLSSFKLYLRKAVAAPEYLAVSSNYFNPRWTGERRLKNVVCVLEYVPRQDHVNDISHPDEVARICSEEFVNEYEGPPPGPDSPLEREYSARTQTTLEQAFSLFDVLKEDRIPPGLMWHVLQAVHDRPPAPGEVEGAIRFFSHERRGFDGKALSRMLLQVGGGGWPQR
jgi:hypothetical protein